MAVTESRPRSGVQLPLELILRILSQAAQHGSTADARKKCLVSKASYEACWPSLWRIIALRNPQQLKSFSEAIYQPSRSGRDHRLRHISDVPVPARRNVRRERDTSQTDEMEDGAAERRERRKQDAIRYVYLNNNKDAAGLRMLETNEKPEMWMISILLAARNVEILHVEEYWSMSYPWETQEEKPLVAYPLMLLSRFSSAVHAAVVASPRSAWVRRMFGHSHVLEDGEAPETAQSTSAKSQVDIHQAIIDLQQRESLRQTSSTRPIAQPLEITLSALAMSPHHLTQLAPLLAVEHALPAGSNAFDRLKHLHLYFAKLDDRLIDALQSLPALRYLRLTRPFSELLCGGITSLLQSDSNRTANGRGICGPGLTCLLIEAGIYMDKTTVGQVHAIQQSPLGRDRLMFISNGLFPTGPLRAPDMDAVVEQEAGGSSTAHVVNYVTSSEERGFQDFVDRAHGGEGVWKVPA